MHSKKRRIAKTNLLNTLQKAFHLNAQSARQDIPVDEIRETQKISRRKFIETTGKAALLTTIGASAFLQACTSKNKPEIVIVGAGIAGLNAAHTLKKSGYLPKIYEASPRTGGRIYTAVDMLAPGLTTELGGEFIDSTHDDIFALIKQFDLPLIDTFVESEKNLTHACYYFDGQIIKDEDILQLFFPFTDQIQKDIDSLSDVISYKTYNEKDLKLLAIFFTVAGASFAGLNPLLLLVLSVLAYIIVKQTVKASEASIGFLMQIPPEIIVPLIDNNKLILLFAKIGALMIGSGYVIFAYLKMDLVDTNILPLNTILDTIAFGLFAPGPILSTVTFLGYQLNLWQGALFATLGFMIPIFVYAILGSTILSRA